MELERAQIIANQVKEKLAPYCERIEIAGSIRRRRPWVKDIDLVCIPKNQGQFVYQLQQLGPFKVCGNKLIRVSYQPIELDVYVATPETWATLLLIRTGSTKHNVMLCKLARQKGMKLHADGSGLFEICYDKVGMDTQQEREERVAGDTEASIFQALGLKYKEPWERE
jgi:DNA polymerase/3'-5' exonuclease PolX